MHIANWQRLFTFAVRRDRLYLALWIVAAVGLGTFFVPLFPGFVGDDMDLSVLGGLMENPAMVAMCGVKYGETYTLAIMYTQMMLVWVALVVALFNVLLVVRHTRADEEAGRLEVLGSLPVGRSANLFSVTLLAVVCDVVIGLATGLGMAAFDVDTIDLAGSLTTGAALAACGLAFAGLALVIVQATETSRGATGLTTASVGLFYLLRAAGDVSSEPAALASPLGLIERTQPFYSNSLWPVAVLVAVFLGLAAVAFALNRARDLGLGLLPQRPGPAHAKKSLSGEWGMTWRLLRGTLIGWAVACFVTAAAYGSVMGDMQSFVESSDLYRQMMGVSAGDSDMSAPLAVMLLRIMAIIGAVPVIITVNKLASEEKKTRLDAVLGTAASRSRLFLGHALIAGLAAIAMNLLSALGFGLVAQSVMDDPIALDLVLKIALNYTPPLLFIAGLGMCLVGALKKLTGLNWLYLVASFFLVYLGGLLDLPRTAERATPFGFVQHWPTEDFWLWPDLALIAAAAALTFVGLQAYRRRDVTA
ncbi:MAG: hypothetical protein LBS56_08335 [Propionibacteriaceae bacterium]|jgi:ABC-2 type transport system permease protein|nr:hypothetical protein [Propionibacteriaceae bacterium]